MGTFLDLFRRHLARPADAPMPEGVGGRGFEAASTTDRNSTWRPFDGGPNSTVMRDGATLRKYSRDLYNNDPYMQRGIREIVLGIGSLVPHADTGDEGLDAEIDAWHKAWRPFAFDGLSYDLGCELAVTEWLVAGDALARPRSRRPEDGIPIPLVIQLLAADFMDPTHDGAKGIEGGPIINGVEHDAIGRVVAYWLYTSNPHDSLYGYPQSVRVPASAVVHLFEPRAPGQVSGLPEFAPVMMSLRDLKDYSEAHVRRKILESSFGPIIEDADPQSERYAGMALAGGADGETVRLPDGSTAARGLVDSNGYPMIAQADGQAAFAPPGSRVTFPQPTIASDFSMAFNDFLHRVAAGMHVPYARVAGNLTGYNYSSARIDQLPFKAFLAHKKAVATHRFGVPLWRAWVEAGVLSGAIPLRAIDKRIGTVAYKFPPPAFQEADLAGMTKAVEKLVRIGGQSWTDAVEAFFGGNVNEIIRENARDFGKASAAGLVLDCNPAQTSQSGGTQPTTDNTSSDGE